MKSDDLAYEIEQIFDEDLEIEEIYQALVNLNKRLEEELNNETSKSNDSKDR